MDQCVIFFHGTPSDAAIWTDWLALLETASMGAIAFSRPGYGGSTRRIARQVADINKDVIEIIDAFGVDKFVAVGWSGGGPHALASVAVPQCVGVIALASLSPFVRSKPESTESIIFPSWSSHVLMRSVGI